MTTELIEAVRDAEAALSEANTGSAIALGAALQRLLAALSAPPADDVRDLLVEARQLVDSWDHRGSWSADSPVGMVMRLADALEAAEVRPRGTVTDAEVERILDALAKDHIILTAVQVRTALVVAREVHP